MPSPTTFENEGEEKLILEEAIRQLTSKYREVCGDYRHLGTKIFTLTATELAVVTFIFAANTKFHLALLSNVILFGVGIGAIIVSLSYHTHLDFMRYLKQDYFEAYMFCRKSFRQRRILFDAAIILFVSGVILLMVLKFGGASI